MAFIDCVKIASTLVLRGSIELQRVVSLKFALHGITKFELSVSSKYERPKLILSVTLLKVI
jgi:hypothetical protein